MHTDVKRLELHSFADASERAYGACIYIRSTDFEDSHHTSLVCSRSRVSPLKNLSLPRLELCAALLSAQLTQVLQSINIKFDCVYHWSDSNIALAWIKSCPRRWTTFVANRVSAIQELSDSNDWHYVKSSQNAADIISRGMSPISLLQSRLWWKGPSWLTNNVCEWSQDTPLTEQEIPE